MLGHPHPAPLPPSLDLMQAIKDFAKKKRLKIPPETLVKLKTDPYFKYCFSDLIRNNSVSGEKSERLVLLLKFPGPVNPEDYGEGISLFINNFYIRMPGGGGRKDSKQALEKHPDDESIRDQYEQKYSIYRAIDDIFEREDIEHQREHAQQLCENFRRERGRLSKQELYSRYLEFMKLCVDVFNILTQEYGFNWEELQK